MITIDEVKDFHTKYTSLTFIDMLEALARVADMKSIPKESDLEAAGVIGCDYHLSLMGRYVVYVA